MKSYAANEINGRNQYNNIVLLDSPNSWNVIESNTTCPDNGASFTPFWKGDRVPDVCGKEVKATHPGTNRVSNALKARDTLAETFLAKDGSVP